MSQKIKILHIIKSLGRGGAEMLLPETLRIHDRNKFDFHYLYFLPWKDQMVKDIQTNGGTVTCFASNNNIELMLKLGKVIRYILDNEIKIIHAHLPWAGVLARIAGKRTGIPVIYTEHNKQERYHFATRWLNLASINLTKDVVAVSEDVANSIFKNKRGLKTSVTTIVNGANTQHFRRSGFNVMTIREKFNIPASSSIVGTIAVFRFQKRLDLWLELAGRILKTQQNVHFIIVGDGPLRDDLLRKRNELGLQERVHMPGLEQEVRPYLAAFDIFMMTSVFEGLPIALLEAMSMQCSVVATAAGGIGEVVRDKVDGLLCAVDEPEKIVEYTCSLLRDSQLRMTYGENARRRVEECFSMEKMVRQLELLYSRTAIQS